MLNFSYLPVFQNHLTLTAYSALTLSFIAMYIFKLNIVRFVIFFAALVLGIISGHIEYLGLALILLFCGLYYVAHNAKNPYIRKGFFLIVLLCSVSIMLTKVPGLFPWEVLYRAYITDDAIPYSMRFNFDKSLIGLFFIWFSTYSLANGGKWGGVLKTGILCGLAAIVVLLLLSLLLGYVKFDLKFTPLFYIWAIHNLIFVSIAEEAIFRGMIQQSLMTQWQHYKIGKWLALLVAAILFGLVHYKGGIRYMLLAGVAGLFYGYAYMKTRKIESSVITHFMVNAVHFVCFTYPALASAFGE